MKHRRHGPEKVGETPFRKFARKKLVRFAETLQKIIFGCRRVDMRYGFTNRLSSRASPKPPSDYIPSRELSGRQALPHPHAPIIPQVSQSETLIGFHFEDFVQPEMAAMHAF
jgi:hypothetical protein